MFTFIWTLVLTAAWSILYFLTVRCERKRYNELYKLFEGINKCSRKVKIENAELKAENRELKTKLKEQAVNMMKGGKNER